MEKLTSILVVANRTTADRVLLGKAVALARCVGAQIYLFSCDTILIERNDRLLPHDPLHDPDLESFAIEDAAYR
jgi:hypothetical protein